MARSNTGTKESLLEASVLINAFDKWPGLMIAHRAEVLFCIGWINSKGLELLADDRGVRGVDTYCQELLNLE